MCSTRLRQGCAAAEDACRRRGCIRISSPASASTFTPSDRAASICLGDSTPESVRAGYDSQGAVARVGDIEMQSHRDHRFQDAGWRLDMDNALLDRPRPEPLGRALGCNGDGKVLVPRNLPIGAFSFVKPQGPNSPDLALRRKRRADPCGKTLDLKSIEQVAMPSLAVVETKSRGQFLR